MTIRPEIQKNLPDYAAWRQTLHQNAQTAFEETFASDFVAEKLKAWGIEVHRGLAKTGVVGVIKGKRGEGPMIGLRADMDALNLEEQSGKPYASRNKGKMHACGHEGHVATLLAAAEYLAQTADFKGSVALIFQPAEEGTGGAKAMIAEGLFDRFPCRRIFGMHNWPSIPIGKAAVRAGPVMANSDHFTLHLKAKGGHAAFPHLCTDAILAASHVVTALQSLVSRNLDPLEAGVVSVAHIEAGQTYNVMPESALLRGTARSFKPGVRELLKDGIGRIAENVCRALGAEVAGYNYEYGIDATVNDEKETAFCAGVLKELLGEANVDTNMTPVMGGEDFGAMLDKVPGCYIALGSADAQHTESLHSPRFDFNDAIIPIGASYWVRLVEAALEK